MESYGIEKLVINSKGGAVWLNPDLSWNGNLAGFVKWMEVAATAGGAGFSQGQIASAMPSGLGRSEERRRHDAGLFA